MREREDMSTSFGRAAATYEAGRPEYPAEAVEWMLEPVASRKPLQVADVGAGTGKLTRAVLALGADVVAIDPDTAMLEQLRVGLPEVRTVEGTAERLPLPDASVDAVVLGQAWHWVDPDAGSAEVGRVLRPGGVLGLVWNIRDEREPWVARLTEIMHGSNAEQLIAGGGPWVAAPFARLERREWTWSRRVAPAGQRRRAARSCTSRRSGARRHPPRGRASPCRSHRRSRSCRAAARSSATCRPRSRPPRGRARGPRACARRGTSGRS